MTAMHVLTCLLAITTLASSFVAINPVDDKHDNLSTPANVTIVTQNGDSPSNSSSPRPKFDLTAWRVQFCSRQPQSVWCHNHTESPSSPVMTTSTEDDLLLTTLNPHITTSNNNGMLVGVEVESFSESTTNRKTKKRNNSFGSPSTEYSVQDVTPKSSSTTSKISSASEDNSWESNVTDNPPSPAVMVVGEVTAMTTNTTYTSNNITTVSDQ